MKYKLTFLIEQPDDSEEDSPLERWQDLQDEFNCACLHADEQILDAEIEQTTDNSL